MKTERQFIEINKLCSIYDISPDLIISLEEHDLISVFYTEESVQIDFEELGKFEQLVRLYFDLGINVEGLAVIHDLLEERENLRQELHSLRSRI